MGRWLRYYAIKIAVLAVLLAASWAAFFALGDSWYQLLVAVYLAAVLARSPSSATRPGPGRSADPAAGTTWLAWCTAS
ncbi:MAG: hypothetical protein ACR2MP_19795 [Streptosporangiaceae bacterium]